MKYGAVILLVFCLFVVGCKDDSAEITVTKSDQLTIASDSVAAPAAQAQSSETQTSKKKKDCVSCSRYRVWGSSDAKTGS